MPLNTHLGIAGRERIAVGTGPPPLDEITAHVSRFEISGEALSFVDRFGGAIRRAEGRASPALARSYVPIPDGQAAVEIRSGRG